MGIVVESCGYRARGVSFRGKFVLSRHVAYKTKWGHHVAKRSSDARQAYPEVTGGRYPGKIRFIEPHGGNGPRRHVPVWGLQKGPGPRGQYLGKSILSRNGGYKKRGLPCC